MRIFNSLIILTLFLSTAPAYAARTILYYENECCRNITEGEFAILYCQGLKLKEPSQGWTVQTAAAALSALGHQPEGGWVLSRFLSEAVCARLLRNSPFFSKPFTESVTQNSNTLITIARARGIVPADDTLNQGEYAVLLATALKLPLPPGCSPEQAIEILNSQQPPVKPALGWKPATKLTEGDMLQILVHTPFRPTITNPMIEVSAIQAYSLLFGKYEVATQGQFGMFMVEALGAQAPAGGWNPRNSLEYLQKEYALSNHFGWNPAAPLCAETFEDALRQILIKNQVSAGGKKTGGSKPQPAPSGTLTAASLSQPNSAESKAPGANLPMSAAQGNRQADEFIKEVKRSGMLPSDKCSLVPTLQLKTLQFAPNCPTLPCTLPVSPQ